MNLFILSLFQKEIAEWMFDKHIVKIILEAVQMLCTAKLLLDTDDSSNDKLYKISHKNHPVSLWVRKSYKNYLWTLILVNEMHNEWRYRFNHPLTKFHKSFLVAVHLLKNKPAPNKFELSFKFVQRFKKLSARSPRTAKNPHITPRTR